MTYKTFAELAESRFSARDFFDTPISKDILDSILKTASKSPSWSNTRPYALAIAQGERKNRIVKSYLEKCDAMLKSKDKSLSEYERKALEEQSSPDGDVPVMQPYPDDLKQRSAELGLSLYAHLGIDRHDFAARNAHMKRNFEAFGAPVIGFVFARSDFMPFSAMDAGLMLQTLFLAAKSEGVDSCPLGVLANWRSPLDAEYDIPKNYELLTGFALGYASDYPVNKFRAKHPNIELL